MASAADPILDFERSFDKRVRWLLVTLSVGGAITIGLLGYLFVASPGLMPTWWPAFLALEAALLGIFIVWFRKRITRIRSLPRAMKSRLASEGIGPGPTLVFDNGMVLSMDQAGVRFYQFGSPGGVKSFPRAADVGSHIRGILRFRQALRVGRKQGPESLRPRLDGIQVGIGASFSWLFVYMPKPSAPVDPRRASWIAYATFGGPRFRIDADRVLSQIDALGSLLDDAVEVARASKTGLWC